MARPSKLTLEICEQIENLIGIGCSIEDSCAHVGVSRQTFYNWKAESIRLRELAERKGNTVVIVGSETFLFLTFLDRLTRAQANARVVAVAAVRTGLVNTQQVETITETYTETRLRKVTRKMMALQDEVLVPLEITEEVPYEHQRTRVKRSVREQPPDWHAGIEFLKRRMPEEWSERITIEHLTDRAVADIRTGAIEFEALVEAYDYEFATFLFAKAGIPVPLGESQAEDTGGG